MVRPKSPLRLDWVDPTVCSLDYHLKIISSLPFFKHLPADAKSNKQIYDMLFEKKVRIESVFGDKLMWQRLDDKRASRVYFPILTGLTQKDKWQETHSTMIDAMKRLQKALQPELKNN